MNSDAKSHAIFTVAIGVGVIGTALVGWPALPAAAFAIAAIAFAPERKDSDHD